MVVVPPVEVDEPLELEEVEDESPLLLSLLSDPGLGWG